MWFKAHPELQAEILKELKIKEFIGVLSSSSQIEVLQDAPKYILDDVGNLLHERARKKLGYRMPFTQVWLT